MSYPSRLAVPAIVALSLLVAPSPAAADPSRGAPSSPGAAPTSATPVVDVADGSAVAGVPRYADARIPAFTGAAPTSVAVLTELDLFRTRDRSPRRQADYVTIQAVVAPASGRLVKGPVLRLELDGRSRIPSGSTGRIDRRSGEVRADLALTARQRAALRKRLGKGDDRSDVARMVRVVVRHYRDSNPDARVHEDVASVGARARYAGHRLRLPRPPGLQGQLESSSPGQVRLTNGTSNPLVLMAGPNSCMYDSIYEWGTYSGDHGSQLGTMNGLILQPGQSVQAYVLNDKSDLDGREDNQDGQPVLDDYTTYLNDAFVQAQSSDPADLPELIIPAGDDDDTWKDMDSSLGFFGLEATKAIVGDEGLWGAFAAEAAEAEGVSESELSFLDLAFEGLSEISEFAEPILEFAATLIELFDNSCMAKDGYIMVGATDQAHPWRQFMQVYDWGSATPTVPTPGSQGFNAYSNGLVANVITPFSPQVSAPDGLVPPASPSTTNGVSTWVFTEADTPVDAPAVVRSDPGTRQVTCSAADPATTQPPPGLPGRIDILPPYEALVPLPGDPPGPAPRDYVVGDHYIVGSATAVVHYTPDGKTWYDVQVPQGGSSVTLPADGKAVLVNCDVQVAEVFSKATLSGRPLLMGTRVPSDVVVGPDYTPTPAPPAPDTPMGSWTMYAGPKGPTRALIATEQGLWWDEAGASGFLDVRRDAVQNYPGGVARVRTADGYLWGTRAANGGTQLVRFDPTSFQRTTYPLTASGGAGSLALDSNGNIWFVTGSTLGWFTPATGQTALGASVQGAEPVSLFAGPDRLMWWTLGGTTKNPGGIDKFVNPSGFAGAEALPNTNVNAWISDGTAAWTVTNGTRPPTVLRVIPSPPPIGRNYATFPMPTTLAGYEIVFDAQRNWWVTGTTGPTNNDAVIMRRDNATGAWTTYSVPYHQDSPVTVGTDGRVYIGGDSYDNRITAVSTGDPAVTPPSTGMLIAGSIATCGPATWSRDATSPATVLRRYWTDGLTGEVLANGDSVQLLSSMAGRQVQCHEVATVPWVPTPLTSDSTPTLVHPKFATSGALQQQTVSGTVDLPGRIRPGRTTTLVDGPVRTNAGQTAQVSVVAYRTGTTTQARDKDWTVLREGGSVSVRVRGRTPLTVQVTIRAPRTGTHAPLLLSRLYRVSR